MLGAIIGDIVGSRFEFNNHRSTEFELFHKDCSFTDDTICTVAIAEALLCNYSFEEALIKWCSKYPNPMGGYGMGFRNWVFGRVRGPYYSYGNGSAMRVSPVGWLCSANLLQKARQSAEVTHSHPEGIKGAECIAYAIWHLKLGFNKEWVRDMAKTNYGYNLNLTCDQIRQLNTFNETCQVTVPQAIRCFLESTDFESAIRLAVSIGGDSDTIAAITGSLAEAHYGVPEWMKEKAMEYLPKQMKEVINQFNNTIK